VFVSRCVSPSLRAQGGHRKVMGKGSSLMTFGSYPKCKTAPRRPQRQAPPRRSQGRRVSRRAEGGRALQTPALGGAIGRSDCPQSGSRRPN
jgi:hypothetical protein